MKKFSFALIAIIIINIGSVAFAQDSVLFNNDDINILKNILYETQNNIDILNWNFENPNNIKEAEWKKLNDEYHLVSLDLSNLLINGDIDLSNCEYLEYCTFENTGINSIQLPCSLKYITDNAFKNCKELQIITINADNTTIGSNSFSGCISLKGIVNAEKIMSVGRNAFNNCESLSFYFLEYKANCYAENYAVKNNIIVEKSALTNCYGYAGKINYKNTLRYDLNEDSSPYYVGNVSIYTADKKYIETVSIDETGKFLFNNIIIGKKYRIVIDGKTAIPREEYFVASTLDYCISPKDNCFAIMICDYNRDGIFNYLDSLEFKSKYTSSVVDEEDNVYDLNGDGLIDGVDKSIFNMFYSQKKERYTYN